MLIPGEFPTREDAIWAVEKRAFPNSTKTVYRVVQKGDHKERQVVWQAQSLRLWTSYFALYAKHPRAVAISLGTPPWYSGRVYKALAPTRELLSCWRAGQLSEEQYTQIYKEATVRGAVYTDLQRTDPFEARPTQGCWGAGRRGDSDLLGSPRQVLPSSYCGQLVQSQRYRV